MCYRCLDSKISLEQGNVCFKVIGQVFNKLWQFETRHVNVRNLREVLMQFFRDPIFWIMQV